MNIDGFADLQRRLYLLAVKKNNDYGDNNITKFGLKGVVVRLSDKIERLIQLVWNERDVKVSDEKIEDTLMDIANYGMIGYLVLNNDWETTNENKNTIEQTKTNEG